ncbi:hypothetical protein ABH920_007875 [Catenulispora sp. EB89]|uniref:hypothetical protein n=1 Tax=Catenulispora sp. EB89 TaxID=3156257 RepID=UPI003514D37E
MKRSKKLAATLTAVATIALPVVAAGTASAGTNGQQVAVSTWYSDEVKICGTNQNNKPNVCTPKFSVPGSSYVGLKGWWYKGWVTITGYDNDNGSVRTARCYIPASQSGDWVYCDGRDNKTL